VANGATAGNYWLRDSSGLAELKSLSSATHPTSYRTSSNVHELIAENRNKRMLDSKIITSIKGRSDFLNHSIITDTSSSTSANPAHRHII